MFPIKIHRAESSLDRTPHNRDEFYGEEEDRSILTSITVHESEGNPIPLLVDKYGHPLSSAEKIKFGFRS